MLEGKFRGVILFVLNIACLYPLQTSTKTVKAFWSFNGDRNIKFCF